MLTLEGVDAFCGVLQTLYRVSLDIRQGEIVALVGANAAGKTTTLRVISGTLPARAGRVVLDGDNLGVVSAHRKLFFTRSGSALAPTTPRRSIAFRQATFGSTPASTRRLDRTARAQ